jgi:hypothetical protein
MSTITTASRWIALPTSGGAADRARKNQPADGALMQVLSSNATLACRENGLRTLWERGPAEVYLNTPSPHPDQPEWMPWNVQDETGYLIDYAGTHRVRSWGETGFSPRIVLATRGSVSSALYDLVVALYVLPLAGYPDNFTPYAVARTNSTSTADLVAVYTLTPEVISAGARHEVPSPGTSPPVPVTEMGPDAAVALYVGAYCTSNSSGQKAELGGLTIYLEEPA